MPLLFILMMTGCRNIKGQEEIQMQSQMASDTAGLEEKPTTVADVPTPIALDTQRYMAIVHDLAHHDTSSRWYAQDVLPLPGAILPFRRIVAYYGNFYSKRMGILGALPVNEMLQKLNKEVTQWNKADSSLQAIPAIHYIAVTAQGEPGRGKKYRLRMPEKEIRKALAIADSINGLLFLDIQVGHSTIQEEIPKLSPYLQLPNVHLGIDPEYSMKTEHAPGAKVGTFDAADINYAAEYLANLVNENQLPPKVLVVHRFTKGMVTGYKEIVLRPEVQIVMHMDGFGGKAKKESSYQLAITKEPVQFAGFKLFYKNDAADPSRPYLMTPAEILSLHPKPVYIQYQ